MRAHMRGTLTIVACMCVFVCVCVCVCVCVYLCIVLRDRGWTWSVTVRVCSHEIRGIGRQRTTFRIDLVAPRVGLSPILTHLALGCVCMCVLCGGLGVHASAAADDVLPRSSSLSLSCARDSALRTLSRSAAWRCLLLANLVRLDCPGCVMLWSGAVARARTHTHIHTHTRTRTHTPGRQQRDGLA